jgi:chorismate synthase
MPIVLRVAYKPPATIGKAQPTADFTGADKVLEAKVRPETRNPKPETRIRNPDPQRGR